MSRLKASSPRKPPWLTAAMKFQGYQVADDPEGMRPLPWHTLMHAGTSTCDGGDDDDPLTGGGRKKFPFLGHFQTAIASCVFIYGGRDRGYAYLPYQ